MGGSIGSDAGNNSFSVSMEMMQPDLDLGLEILADVLLNATFPAEVIEREKVVQSAAIKAEDEHMTHQRRAQSPACADVRLASVRAAHLRHGGVRGGSRPCGNSKPTGGSTSSRKTRCWRCSATSKRRSVRARVEALFAGMPAGEQALPAPPSPPALTQTRSVEKFEDKEQAVLMVGYPGTTDGQSGPYALELIDEASSDLGSRFFIRIREELGLAYFVGSSQMLGLSPGMFHILRRHRPAQGRAGPRGVRTKRSPSWPPTV